MAVASEGKGRREMGQGQQDAEDDEMSGEGERSLQKTKGHVEVTERWDRWKRVGLVEEVDDRGS